MLFQQRPELREEVKASDSLVRLPGRENSKHKGPAVDPLARSRKSVETRRAGE